MSLFLNTDVTAVKLHNGYIIAGVGSYIHFFNVSHQKLLERKQVLKGQKIYGIIPFGDEILIYGGKQFTVVHIEELNYDNIVIVKQLFEIILCDDWIQAGIWREKDEIVLLTAHNVVQKWDITRKCLKSEHIGQNNCIIYSGLLVALDEDILVFAGTVFSEVIIHSCLRNEVLHTLKGHNGVIFSIACDPEKEIIVTTSDDRSVHVWTPKNSVDYSKTSLSYWNNIDIVCKFKVYAHSARVMRCLISEECIVSVGEDAAICFWDFEGKLIIKRHSHQNGPIWAVDSNKTHLVTGGGDNRLLLHPLTLATNFKESYIIKTNNTVKRLVFTAKGNIVILCDNEGLIYYNIEKNTETVILCKQKEDSPYKLLSVSTCKQLISTVDMSGNLDVFVENCKYESVNRILTIKLKMSNICSMHWAGNRFIVLCCEMGNIIVFGSNTSENQVYAKFVLPNSKERWLTAAAIDETLTNLVFSDRCGNLHFYNKDKIDPIKTIRKVHGRYGATSISFANNNIITTGRDGTIKYFSFGKTIKQTRSLDLNFQWVERFIDKDKSLVCGFKERTFIIYDIKHCSTIVQVPCGGGHRTWDINRLFLKRDGNFEECINFIYFKQYRIHNEIYRLKNIVSKIVINGSHVKEINSLKVFEFNKYNKIIISGSEDTTVRISSFNIIDAYNDQNELTYKHLSSIKCIQIHKLEDRKILLISAGGRAQICIKRIQFIEGSNDEIVITSEDIINYMIKGTDKERKGNHSWRNHTIDFDPETRIMAMAIVNKDNDLFYVIAGCSDSFLRIYKLNLYENNSTFELIDTVAYHKTCVLNIHAFKYKDSDLLVTTSTIGEVVLWTLFENDKNINPILHTKTNKSGINDLSIEVLENNILIATCGDDNALHIVALSKNEDVFYIENRWSTDNYHCSLVSGVLFLDCKYIISVSIDQRVTLSRWNIIENKLENEFVTQMYSDVPDIHGVEVVDRNIDYVTICIYGKGMEIMKVPFKDSTE